MGWPVVKALPDLMVMGSIFGVWLWRNPGKERGDFPCPSMGEQNYLSVDDDPPLTIETDSSRHEVCFFDMAGVEGVTALRHACKAVTLTSRGRF